MLDLVVSGRIVFPGGRVVEGEIGVSGGSIAALAGPGELTAHERIEAPSGQLIRVRRARRRPAA
jgi:hypothetical protein